MVYLFSILLFFQVSLREAEQLIEEGQYEKALEVLPATPETSALRGIAHYRLNQFDKAYKAFEEAAATDEDTTSIFNAANALTQAGKYEEALKFFELANELSPRDEEIVNNMEYVQKLIEKEEEQKDNNQQEEEEQEKEDKQDGQGDNQEQEENQDQQEKNQEGEDNQEKQDENEQGEDENSEKENEGKSDEQENSQSGNEDSVPEGEGQRLLSQVENLVDAVQENRSALQNYRREKAQEYIEANPQNVPQKGW